MATTRRGRKAAGNDVASVQALVDDLIRENRRLKRELARAGERNGIDGRALAGLVRKVERAVAEVATSAGSLARRRPRRPASPETLEKRRQALARAREARAAKRRSHPATPAETGEPAS